MSVQVAPPAAPAAGSAQALFKEARRRRRRRWMAGTGAVLVVAAAVAVSAVSWPGQPAGHGSSGMRPAGPARAVSSSVALAWFDGTSLRVGYLQPGGRVSEHAVAEVNAHYLPLVRAGERVYWVDPAGTFVPALGHWSQVVRYLDVATGKIGIAGGGQTVFLSADGRDLFMSQTATTLTEAPVTAPGAVRQLTLPPGWYLPGGDGLADLFSGAGLATANGIVVQSQQDRDPAGLVMALWDPASGQVTVIGRTRGVIGAYTPPGARYSLLAWLPARCCALTVTNTATRSAMTVHSPLPGGFALGGAFSPASPAGAWLAVYLNAGSGSSARLALVDLATGALRVVPGVRVALGADIAWARWLPGGSSLIAGATTGGGYLVDVATLAARPLAVRGRGAVDVNFTAAVVPLGQRPQSDRLRRPAPVGPQEAQGIDGQEAAPVPFGGR
jgi:hypothetical protein